MPLKVDGDPGYGSILGPEFSLSGGLGGSEALPLLVPEAEPDLHSWRPLNREQLEATAGGPSWRKFRSRLVLIFWLAWLVMLGSAVMVIFQSPRPVAPTLQWWQKELFYRIQPAMFLDVDNTEPSAINKVSARLPYLRSLGVGVMVLEGLFEQNVSLANLTETDHRLGSLTQIHQLITDSHNAGVRVILDLCGLDLPAGSQISNDTEIMSDTSDYVEISLRYWLERGVLGFEVCDTDLAFSEETLSEWRRLMEKFSSENNERIVMVREMDDSSPEVSVSKPVINSSLVDLVIKSLLPESSQQFSAAELAEVMENKLNTLQGKRSSWRVDGRVAQELKKILLVLMMTLPGTPVIRYGDEIGQSANLSTHSSIDDQHHGNSIQQLRRSTMFFKSLSRLHSREETLLYGNFLLLPFNSSAPSNSTATPPLAYLRSFGCAHVLVLFNLNSEPHSLDPDWAPSLPDKGVFVTSTGLDRLGSVSLQSITLQPHEAIVIKLFEEELYGR